MRRHTIRAEISSSDLAKRAVFDITRWLATAPVETIVALAHSAWRGDAFAHDAALQALEADESIADVLQYVMYLRHGGLGSGYRLAVDSDAALTWLSIARPEVVSALGGSVQARERGGRQSARSGRPRISTNGTKSTRPRENA
jgi:hypothetical protein